MEIRRVYIDDIIDNEKNIKNYLEDLISETTKVDVKERIKEIYDRMKVFLSDNSAIIYGGFDNDAMIGFIWAYEINSMVYHISIFLRFLQNDFLKVPNQNRCLPHFHFYRTYSTSANYSHSRKMRS